MYRNWLFVVVLLSFVTGVVGFSLDPDEQNKTNNEYLEVFNESDMYYLNYDEQNGSNYPSLYCDECFSPEDRKYDTFFCVNSTNPDFPSLKFTDYSLKRSDVFLATVYAQFSGMFGCDRTLDDAASKDTNQQILSIKFNDATSYYKLNTPSSGMCYCANCAKEYPVQLNTDDILTNYKYGEVNEFHVSVKTDPIPPMIRKESYRSKSLDSEASERRNSRRYIIDSSGAMYSGPKSVKSNVKEDTEKAPPTTCLSEVSFVSVTKLFNKTISSVSPRLMPKEVNRNIVVTVATNNFSPTHTDVYCLFKGKDGPRFNSSTSPNTWAGDWSFNCSYPVNTSGVYDICMAFSTPWDNPSFRYQETLNCFEFIFYTNPNITKVKVHTGTNPGTIILYTDLDGFVNGVGNCLFTPESGSSIFMPVMEYNEHSGTIKCALPSLPQSSDIKVQVSLNGVDFSEPFTFKFKTDPKNTALLIALYLILGIGFLIAVISMIVWIKYRKNLDGYERIREGNAVVALKDIVLGERIGRGTFGEVYKGVWRGATVAVKKLNTQQITEEFVREFEKEVGLMRSLRSPNVLQFLGSAFQPPNNVCIVMEYMSRGSLHSILHNYQTILNWDLILHMIVDTVRGMVYLHTCTPPVIHRDLKSHNLLVDEFWRVKVCDFGLSTVLEHQSQTMTACGTPCWTAPEVLKHLHYTVKADVYSFAIVLWECAARVDPYQGMAPFRVIYAVGREKLRPRVPPGLPPEYVKLMRECWDDDPERRPTFDAVLEAVGDMCGLGWKGQPLPHEALTAAAAAAAAAAASHGSSMEFGGGSQPAAGEKSEEDKREREMVKRQEANDSDAEAMTPLLSPTENTPLLPSDDQLP